jgi:hypothetical protein
LTVDGRSYTVCQTKPLETGPSTRHGAGQG